METASNKRGLQTFILTLLNIPGIGGKTVTKLLKGNKERIASADLLDEAFARSLQVKAIESGLGKEGISWDRLEKEADGTIAMADACGAMVLQPYDPDYPKRLLVNENFPPILFAKGNKAALNPEKAAAIVGTRNPTDLGNKMGRRLAQLLAEDGYAIVSGLAIGSDTAGHEGALEGEGVTIAVLPTPIDAPVYPRQNRDLATRILDNGGLLISEYAPGIELHDKQLVSNLVARDEWQPGLSDGVIAIETSMDGGTNHAMKHALKTNTPLAVFDYSSRNDIDFYGDDRFSGNVYYIRNGATAIYLPETIERFKGEMDAYRHAFHNAHWNACDDANGGGQLPLNFD